MNTLGVDNGISGALVLVGSQGHLACMLPMPVQQYRGRNEIDVRAVNAWLHDHSVMPDGCRVVIEEPGGSKSARAAMSMAGSFHSLRALFVLRGFTLFRVTPQSWQRAVLGRTCGDSKELALRRAQELWPDEKWLASARCKVAHDGLVDAALIAWWGRNLPLTVFA